jgi:hypothetical protein
MISSPPTSLPTSAHACGVDDNAAPAEILFPEWVTLTERYRIIFRERRRFLQARSEFSELSEG